MLTDLLAGLLTFLSFMIPGFLISLPILKKTEFDFFERLVISFIIGLIIVPSVGFLGALVGIMYTPLTMVAFLIIISMVGLIAATKMDALPKQINFKPTIQSIVLLILILFGVWIRLQSLSPSFYEFDPYFYQMSAQYIVTQGVTPPTDKWVGTPDFIDSHRTQPLTAYMEAQMYFIFSTIKGLSTYSSDLLTIVSGLYPVMVGALLAFIAYLWLSGIYNKNVGVIAALLVSFIPQVIMKTAAGSQELQPWGIFSIMLFMSFFTITIKKMKSNWFEYGIISCIGLFAVILGSQYNLLTVLIYSATFVFVSTYYFIVKKDLELNNLSKFNLMIFLTFFVTYVLLFLGYYPRTTINSFLNMLELPISIASFLVVLLFANYEKLKLNLNMERWQITVAILFIGVILAFLLGFADNIYFFIMFTGQSVPFMKTVAEQSPSPNVLFGSLSYLGYNLIPEIILFSAAIIILYSLYIRNASELIPISIFIFPIAWRGFQTSKYILHLGIVVALAFALLIGEIIIFINSYLKKKENKRIARYAIYGLAGLFVILHASIPVLDIATQGQLYQYLNYVKVPEYWSQPMTWINQNVKTDEGVVSWWDYGHWINWFGQRRTLTRNDHMQTHMDHLVAYHFVEATPQELAQFMRQNDVQYVLFDADLISKWGALVYLAGVWNHCESLEGDNWATDKIRCNSEFDWLAGPGKAGKWEVQHYFEYLYIAGMCNNPDMPLRLSSSFGINYCLKEDGTGAIVEQTGKPIKIENLVRISENGFLNINPDLSWANKGLQSNVYKSNFVQGFFNKSLEGFDLVFDNEMVKIFKLRE